MDKALSVDYSNLQGYNIFREGSCVRENTLLMKEGSILSFKVATPLGTSKKKHTNCAVYWVLGNLPPKLLSSLNSVQLALLCKVNSLKQCGYSEILHLLFQDLVVLEKHGIYVEKLGSSVKGTDIVADNVCSCSFIGTIPKIFISDKVCCFCMATWHEIQNNKASSGYFSLRIKQDHGWLVQEVQQNIQLAKQYGVKGSCPLSDNLQHFYTVGGFPLDILHDLLEGIIPSELYLCIKDLREKKFFTLELLNNAIKEFPYMHSDKTSQPQMIPEMFHAKDTIEGNGHENWSLISLLPLQIGQIEGGMIL